VNILDSLYTKTYWKADLDCFP